MEAPAADRPPDLGRDDRNGRGEGPDRPDEQRVPGPAGPSRRLSEP